MNKPLPPVNPDSAPFWDGCADGDLRLQHCRKCGTLQFPPRARCAQCTSDDLDWETVVAHGHVYSFTVVHRAPTAAFRDDVPYVLALVEFDTHARAMMNVTGCDPDAVHIGMPVDIEFERRESGDEEAWLPVARARVRHGGRSA